MQLADLLRTLRELDRSDKLRVVHFLASELVKEENLLLESN